jgi:hypothetical protein
VLADLHITAKQFKVMGITVQSFIRLGLYRHPRRRALRVEVLREQQGKSAIKPGEVLTLADAELDHIWTKKEAAQAVVDGMPIEEAYQKLWNRSNLRMISKQENTARNARNNPVG